MRCKNVKRAEVRFCSDAMPELSLLSDINVGLPCAALLVHVVSASHKDAISRRCAAPGKLCHSDDLPSAGGGDTAALQVELTAQATP